MLELSTPKVTPVGRSTSYTGQMVPAGDKLWMNFELRVRELSLGGGVAHRSRRGVPAIIILQLLKPG